MSSRSRLRDRLLVHSSSSVTGWGCGDKAHRGRDALPTNLSVGREHFGNRAVKPHGWFRDRRHLRYLPHCVGLKAVRIERTVGIVACAGSRRNGSWVKTLRWRAAVIGVTTLQDCVSVADNRVAVARLCSESTIRAGRCGCPAALSCCQRWPSCGWASDVDPRFVDRECPCLRFGLCADGNRCNLAPGHVVWLTPSRNGCPCIRRHSRARSPGSTAIASALFAVSTG